MYIVVYIELLPVMLEEMDTPVNLSDILFEYEKKTSFGEAEIYDAIRKVKGDEELTFEELSELMAFGFCENYPNPRDGWGKYYGPMMAFSNADGTHTESPSIKRVTPEMIEYWKERSSQTINPLLKSRYLDLIVDFNKIINGKGVDIAIVKELIQENINTARSRVHKYDYNLKLKLERALQLAISYNLSSEIEKCKVAILELEESIGHDSKGGTWGFSYDLLVDNPKITLDSDVEERIIKELEERLERLSSNSELNKVDPWAAEKAATRLANYYRRKKKTSEVTRVIRNIGSAFELILHEGSPLQISGWLDHLQKIFRNYGLMDDAEKVLVKLREIGPKVNEELKPISHKFTIPQEKIDQYLAEVLEGDLNTILHRIAVQFIPDKSRAKDQVLDLSKIAPITFLATLQIQDKKGRTIATIGSIEDDMDGNIVRQISQSISFSNIFLGMALGKVIDTQPLDSIISFIENCPLIEPSRFLIIEEGLEFYYQGNYLVAIHLLVPQVEDGLRNLLEFSGGNVLKPSKGGGFHLRTFDEILRDTTIVNILGENLSLYLRILFTDQRGLNIRNDVSHGMLNPSDFTQDVADRIIHVLLCMALLRKEE